MQKYVFALIMDFANASKQYNAYSQFSTNTRFDNYTKIKKGQENN